MKLKLLSNFFAGAVLLTQALQANTVWTPPVQISTATPLPILSSQAFNDVAYDGSGNAAAVWVENNGVVNQIQTRTYLAATGWAGTTTQLDAALNNGLYPQIDVNQAGSGIAIWLLTIGNVLYYNTNPNINGGVWSGELGLSNSGNVDSDFPPSLSQAPTADFAAAAWGNEQGGGIQTANVAIYTAGAWQANSTILSANAGGEIATTPQVAVNDASEAAVVWIQNSGGSLAIQASTYSGGVWSAPANLTAFGATPLSNPKVGIATNGNAVAIWEVDGGVPSIMASVFNNATNTWSAAVTISTAGVPSADPSLAVAPSGNAYATWTQATGGARIYSAFLPAGSTTWAAPTAVSTTGLESNSYVDVNSSGNAIVVFNSGSGASQSVNSAFRILGGLWQTPVQIVAATLNNLFPVVAINNQNQVVSTWSQYTGTAGTTQASNGVNIDNLGPGNASSFTGKSIINKFLNGTEWVHQLNWTPSTDLSVVGYHLYRNGVLIFTAPASGPFFYVDHGRSNKVADTYVLKSFNSVGTESSGLTVILQ